MKYLPLFLIILYAWTAPAQTDYTLSVKNSTFAASDSLLPFWLWANRSGKVKREQQFLNLTDVVAGFGRSMESGWNYTTGVNVVAGIGETSYTQVNQAFAGVGFRGWELTGGLFHERELYDGLSASNGNLARSLHARPHPRIRIATKGWKPVPFLGSWLGFSAGYDEGLLNDDRFMNNAHLHHKSLYLHAQLSPQWELETGLEHYVMWGGTSPVPSIGKMPTSLNAYLHYITGRSGSDDFPDTDRLNVAGNQLGTYQFRLLKHFAGLDATFFLSHPFEDLSGMNWRNWPDNLIGLHLDFHNKERLITGMIYEYVNTRQQSVRGDWDRQEPDGYYNNGVYRSGFTYYQQMMGSPLFFPVIIRDGISHGVQSNMLQSHHLGIRGALAPHLVWKGLLTHIRHEGRFFSRYPNAQQQWSGLLEVTYSHPRLPIDVGLSTAADKGYGGRNAGVSFSLIWRMN